MSQLKRRIIFRPAWDKRNPDPGKSYGIHSMELVFLLEGPKGTTQFQIFTGWHLPHVREEFKRKGPQKYPISEPSGADVGYHSREPIRWATHFESCPVTDAECWYDGSSLQADALFDRFVRDGEDVVWARLEEAYEHMVEIQAEALPS